MKLNETILVDRQNRPSVSSRVGLQVLFMNDGAYIDPAEVSAVTIFKKSANISPCSILGEDGLISSDVSGDILMQFEVSSPGTNGIALDEDEYTPGNTASGIYRKERGQYVVVLDGISDLSGANSTWDQVYKNGASSVAEYIDVWTARLPVESDFKTIIHEFSLYDDAFTSITEPLMVRASNKLTTKKIALGAKRDLKVTTEFVVENKNIDESIKNLFKDAIATSAVYEIVKINEDHNLPARVTVSSFDDTVDTVKITSRNTFVFPWDTSTLATHAEMIAGNLGSQTGTYYVRMRYQLLNETILTPRFYISVS